MPTATDKEFAQRRAFGTRVRALREEQGMSQEALAYAAGLDRSYMGGVERGERNVSLDNIYRIANALGTALGSLFTDEPPRLGATRS